MNCTASQTTQMNSKRTNWLRTLTTALYKTRHILIWTTKTVIKLAPNKYSGVCRLAWRPLSIQYKPDGSVLGSILLIMANSLARFYSGRTLFLTGGSGYVGKQIIEKLLRSCPAVDQINILMRPKKNMSPDERLDQLLLSPVSVWNILYTTGAAGGGAAFILWIERKVEISNFG